MEYIAQALLLLASLLIPFTWLLSRRLSCSSPSNSAAGRRIPTPPAWPFIGHLHLLSKAPLHRSLAALARRYDGGRTGLLLLRLGARPVLLVSSRATADECFTVHDAALADCPALESQRLVADAYPSIGSTNYSPALRRLRRLATEHTLGAHCLAATPTARDAVARDVAAKLYRCAACGGAAVSMKTTTYELVVNVIMAMVAGERMDEEQVVRVRFTDARGKDPEGINSEGETERERERKGEVSYHPMKRRMPPCSRRRGSRSRGRGWSRRR